MTTSDFKKAYNQLQYKPVVWKKYLKHNSIKVRACGTGNRKCSRCGRHGGHVSQYNLGFCRHCFRELAKSLGFKKYS